MVDNEAASSINDFSINKSFDDDVRTGLDRQTTDKVSPNMQRAVFLNDRVGGDRTIDCCRATDNQSLWNVALAVGRHNHSRRHCQHSHNTYGLKIGVRLNNGLQRKWITYSFAIGQKNSASVPLWLTVR